jgi:hypothetical protein
MLLVVSLIPLAAGEVRIVAGQASNGYVSGAELQVPYTNNPPEVYSGVCKNDQWKDAMVVKLIPSDVNKDETSFLAVKL